MSNRRFFGPVLTLALILSPHLAQAGSPEMLKSSPSPSIWELNDLPLLAPRRYNRFDPGNLSDRLMEQASRYLNAPYRRGGSLQTGKATDCSGFVQYIYKKADINLPRASGEQAQVGKLAAWRMDFSKLLAGDLLFFRQGGRHIGHVGIYLGEGKMIHASSSRRGVTISDLRQEYYQGNFVVAKRLFDGSLNRNLPGKTPAKAAIN